MLLFLLSHIPGEPVKQRAVMQGAILVTVYVSIAGTENGITGKKKDETQLEYKGEQNE